MGRRGNGAIRTETVRDILVRNMPAAIELLDPDLNFIEPPALRLHEGSNRFSSKE
jgi:hypothetical protein